MISWPTAAVLVGALALFVVLAWVEPAHTPALILGGLTTIVSAVLPALHTEEGRRSWPTAVVLLAVLAVFGVLALRVPAQAPAFALGAVTTIVSALLPGLRRQAQPPS